MPISDVSSYVCSADLLGPTPAPPTALYAQASSNTKPRGKDKKKARQVSLPGLPPPDTSPSSGGGCGASERSADFERVRGAQGVAHDVGAPAAERLVLPVFLPEDVARLEAQGQVRVPHPEALPQPQVAHRAPPLPDRKSTRLNS